MNPLAEMGSASRGEDISIVELEKRSPSAGAASDVSDIGGGGSDGGMSWWSGGHEMVVGEAERVGGHGGSGGADPRVEGSGGVMGGGGTGGGMGGGGTGGGGGGGGGGVGGGGVGVGGGGVGGVGVDGGYVGGEGVTGGGVLSGVHFNVTSDEAALLTELREKQAAKKKKTEDAEKAQTEVTKPKENEANKEELLETKDGKVEAEMKSLPSDDEKKDPKENEEDKGDVQKQEKAGKGGGSKGGGKGKGKGEPESFTINLPPTGEEEAYQEDVGGEYEYSGDTHAAAGKGGRGEKGGKGGKGTKGGKGAKGGGKGGKGMPGKGGKGAKGAKGGKGAVAAKDKGPKSNTIGLHWSTINSYSTLENSIWGSVDAEGVSTDFEVGDLEAMFGKKVKSVSKKEETDAVKEKKPGKQQLLDANRSRNIEIMLSSIKMPYSELQAILQSYNKSGALAIEQLEKINQFVPEPEEISVIETFQGEEKLLGKAEKYFLAMSKVERFRQCIEVSVTRVTFQSQVTMVQEKAELVLEACEQVKSSQMLGKVLEYVLALGNHLNSGTNRGRAYGFKLDGLLKLLETKGTDGSTTLLHYLVATITKKNPEICGFPIQINKCKAVSLMQFSSLHAEYSRLKMMIEQAEGEVMYASPEADLGRFVESARKQVDALETNLENMGYAIEETIYYFGENPAGCVAEEPFKALVTFTDAFARATLDNERAQQAKKDMAIRKAETIKRREALKAQRAEEAIARELAAQKAAAAAAEEATK